MNVISIKEYAKNNNVSYEAVRQQVVRYASDLEGHIIKDGRQQFLDEEAVAFLDGKRQKNPVVIYQVEKDEEIERLTDENKALLVKVSTLQDRLLEASEKATAIALLEADNEAIRARAEEAERRAGVADQERRNTEKVLEEMRREAKMRADEAQAAEEQRIEAERLLAEREREIEELRNAGLFKRLFGWGK